MSRNTFDIDSERYERERADEGLRQEIRRLEDDINGRRNKENELEEQIAELREQVEELTKLVGILQAAVKKLDKVIRDALKKPCC